MTRAALLAAALAATGCAGARFGTVPPPDGAAALGLEFGAGREAVARRVRGAGIAVRDAADDPDALLADRCPGGPARAPCRLLFGPQGLYAAQVEVRAADAAALRAAAVKGLGAPDDDGDPAPPAEGIAALLAAWRRPGWTVTVARSAPRVEPALAILRVEHDPVAPPVVAGVPLGRLRADVEAALDRQGAVRVARDEDATTWLGCPQGAAEAVSCVVTFRGGRAAAVTEIQPPAAGDRDALDAWRALARRLEREIGRPPETSCPDAGPDRVAGDCTATWSSDRLVVVVGAHRSAGASHRGAISVYTAFTYPALADGAGDAAAEPR